MNLMPTFGWFANIRWHLPRRVHRPDFADMGTAFGLDASLDEALLAPVAQPAPAAKYPHPGFGQAHRPPPRNRVRAGR